MRFSTERLLSLTFVIVLVVIMLVSIRHDYDKKPPTGHLELTVGEVCIFSLMDNKYIKYNLEKDTEYEIYLDMDAKTFTDTYIGLSIDKGNIQIDGKDTNNTLVPISNSKPITIKSDSDANLTVSVFTYNKSINKEILYTSNFNFLSSINDFSNEKEDLILVLTGDIKTTETLIIKRPCEFFLNGFNFESTQDFIVDFESTKPFIIHMRDKKQIRVNAFYANTPNSDITIDKIFFKDEPEYAVRAKTLNGKSIGTKTTVKSAEKFLQLLDDNHYPYLYPDTTISVGNFILDNKAVESFYNTFKKEITVTKPVRLVINKGFEIKDVVLNIQTDEKGTLVVNVDENANFSYHHISIDAPNCSLLWTNSAPKEDYVAKYMNVQTYQGKPVNSFLGGNGKGRIIEFASNDSLGLEWVVKGNVIEAQIPFDTSDIQLADIEISFMTSEGTAEIDKKYVKDNNLVDLHESPLIVVTDEKGKTRTYMVSVKRKANSLPIIYIYTDDYRTIDSKEEYIPGSFMMDADHVDGNYTIPTTSMNIRGRGNSTWRLFDKKPYRIKFDEKVSLFGLAPNRDWVLLANYADHSLLRNYVAMEMGKKLTNLEFTPSSYPVDLFVNGEYMGVYSIGEQIEVAKSRVDIDEDYDDPDTGYLLEVGGTDNVLELGVDFFHSMLLKWVAIKSPDTRAMSKEHFDFISQFTKDADNAIVRNLDYENYVDIDSVIDWVILHEFTCNLDSGFRRSCFLYKDKGGKLRMGPIWDFDLAFGNYFRDNSYDTWFTCGGETLGSTWTTFLYQYPKFNEKYKTRWNEVKDVLKDTALSAVTNGKNMVYKSAMYNFEKWNKLLGNKTSLQPEHIREMKTYDDHINYLLNFINTRFEWLDNAINNLPS
ncbi:MAG TPA: hypothetical protein GXZ66_10620 [Clostridiaceae bacterium]|jgi:hypothetical protein|nr:hypothetical protein [Clostridiaceae bacterium]